MKTKVSASILNCDFAHLEREMKKAEKAGVDSFHLDIMDGQFVPNISFGPTITAVCRKITDLPLETHLMINDPDNFVVPFAEAGSDAISVHIENTAHIHKTLKTISSLGKKAGVVVNPGTPIESIFPVLSVVDFVLFMSVNPGFGGQKFIPEVLVKVKILRDEFEKRKISIPIEIDGGVNGNTAKEAIRAGVNVLIAGTYIFRNPLGIETAIKELRSD